MSHRGGNSKHRPESFIFKHVHPQTSWLAGPLSRYEEADRGFAKLRPGTDEANQHSYEIELANNEFEQGKRGAQKRRVMGKGAHQPSAVCTHDGVRCQLHEVSSVDQRLCWASTSCDHFPCASPVQSEPPASSHPDLSNSTSQTNFSLKPNPRRVSQTAPFMSRLPQHKSRGDVWKHT